MFELGDLKVAMVHFFCQPRNQTFEFARTFGQCEHA